MNEVIKAVDLTKIYNKEDKKKKEKRKFWKYIKVMLYYICKLILNFYLIIVVEERKEW